MAGTFYFDGGDVGNVIRTATGDPYDYNVSREEWERDYRDGEPILPDDLNN